MSTTTTSGVRVLAIVQSRLQPASGFFLPGLPHCRVGLKSDRHLVVRHYSGNSWQPDSPDTDCTTILHAVQEAREWVAKKELEYVRHQIGQINRHIAKLGPEPEGADRDLLLKLEGDRHLWTMTLNPLLAGGVHAVYVHDRLCLDLVTGLEAVSEDATETCS